MRKIQEIEEPMINNYPISSRTSRTINRKSVASKRMSIKREETEQSPSRENISIMDHIEEFIKDKNLQEAINEMRANLGQNSIDFFNFEEIKEIPAEQI